MLSRTAPCNIADRDESRKRKQGADKIGWIILVSILALLSYLADVGIFEILGKPVPGLGGSMISVILMIACIMMLLRAVKMSKKGEKEILQEQVENLKRQLDYIKKGPSKPTGTSP